jgi:DNA-binding transcriptional MerR regulator
MPAGSHYSIGEVLSLLQEDFPDVTISKIRFLESQGLIDPERTPSGYRRFLERDLERLRWILVQQRDHYLPLKVIRERLEAGEPFAEPVADPGSPAFEADEESARADESVAGPPPSPSESVAGPPPSPSGSVAGPPPSPPESAAAPPPVANETVDPAGAAEARRATPTPPAPAPVGETPSTESPATQPATDGEQGPPAGTPARTPGGDDATNGQPAAAVNARPSVVRPRESLIDADRPRPPEVPIPRVSAPEPGPPPLTSQASDHDGGDTFTRDELAQASGCSVAVLNDLEKFGLVRARAAGPSVRYDTDALAVARLAARFGAHGLEPRHLRSFRQAAEREIGLFAQVVGPLLQRRDPSAHDQANETVRDLVLMASELHRILVEHLASEELGTR